MSNPRYSVPFRRRREGKTDYRYRLRLLRSKMPRLVVRRSNRYITVQVCEFHRDGDRVLVSAHSSELRRFGWRRSACNLPAAYLTGYLAARRAVGRGIETAVLDIGLNTPTKGANVFSALKGALEAGLNIPHSESILPDEERMRGKHISETAVKDFEKTLRNIKEE